MQNGKPIAFASRSFIEKNYAQIEKEILAITFACEKFANYIHGKSTVIQSDHKTSGSKRVTVGLQSRLEVI